MSSNNRRRDQLIRQVLERIATVLQHGPDNPESVKAVVHMALLEVHDTAAKEAREQAFFEWLVDLVHQDKEAETAEKHTMTVTNTKAEPEPEPEAEPETEEREESGFIYAGNGEFIAAANLDAGPMPVAIPAVVPAAEAAPAAPKRRGGRPPGKKNKAKEDKPAREPVPLSPALTKIAEHLAATTAAANPANTAGAISAELITKPTHDGHVLAAFAPTVEKTTFADPRTGAVIQRTRESRVLR